MKNLKFTYLSAKNFLPFGDPGIEIDLSKYGNIILIRGENKDVQDEEEKIASNGTGKSSCPEILVYTLFGKTIKHKLSHTNVINNKNGKKLRTEARWDKYRVVRTRKPDSLRLWESEDGVWDDETEITKGGMPETQKEIEKLLGLTYESFVNVVVFTDNNAGSFLECKVPAKREIVEDVLDLQKYLAFYDVAKKHKNEFREKIKLISNSYDHMLSEKAAAEKRVEQAIKQEEDWKLAKEKELAQLIENAKKVKEELQASDSGDALAKFNDAQDRIKELNDSILDLKEKQTKLLEINKECHTKLDTLRENKDLVIASAQEIKSRIQEKQSVIETSQLKIDRFNSLEENMTCSACFGVIKKENYKLAMEHEKEVIEKANGVIESEKPELAGIVKKLEEINSGIDKLNSASKLSNDKSTEIANKLVGIRNEITELSKIHKPEADATTRILEERLTELKKQAISKKEELESLSPYAEIIVSAKEDVEVQTKKCEDKKTELSESKKKLPYYEFWFKAFGDSGIRKFIIDEIIPALNSRIEYWLQFLIDSKISLKFDNKLEETIERNPSDGDPFVYHAMSGGERRRLNLAVSQAFAHVMMLNSGRSPSIVFLDEVTTNIDPIGVQGVYNMIMELSKEKQVFVTTHDHDLLEMLTGCEVINLEKKNGFTSIV